MTPNGISKLENIDILFSITSDTGASASLSQRLSFPSNTDILLRCLSIDSSQGSAFSDEAGRHSSRPGDETSANKASNSSSRAADICNIWGLRMALQPARTLSKALLNDAEGNPDLSFLNACADLLAAHPRESNMWKPRIEGTPVHESNVCEPAMKEAPSQEMYQGFDLSGLVRELDALKCAKRRRRFSWLSLYHSYNAHHENRKKVNASRPGVQ
eukprot:gene29097-32306_t